MFRNLFTEPSALPDDFESLKSQHSAFTILNLFLLLALLFFHTSFVSFWGTPSPALLVLLGVCFAIRFGELMWVRGREPGRRASAILTGCSIVFNLTLALVLASIIDREDSQYAALLVVPILESAFQFGLAATVMVALAADGIAFYWVWRYYLLHPPVHIGEYFEAGTLSLILLIVAVLVSSVVRHLRKQQAQLAATRERLLQEQKVAAVGRFSTAVAHEIRNPVAMIASSISTAQTMEGADREQMLEIASKESARLVNLTNDLLAYAKPSRPALTRRELSETVHYVADACRAHAAAKGVTLEIDAPEPVPAEYDEALLQQALMNLVLNAVEASPVGQTVSLAVRPGEEYGRIDIENEGGPISSQIVDHLFEPFLTTKPAGTGLGLATAHSVVCAQGGDLRLAGNCETVRFSVLLPLVAR